MSEAKAYPVLADMVLLFLSKELHMATFRATHLFSRFSVDTKSESETLHSLIAYNLHKNIKHFAKRL